LTPSEACCYGDPVKLTGEEVGLVVKKLLEEWKRENLMTGLVSDSELRDRLIEIFLKDLRVEDDLNAEVDTMLAKYEKEFEKGALDRRKMFLMVKAQLVKERRLVL
jgi:hypothetical protein